MNTDELVETLVSYEPRRDVFPPEREGSIAQVVSAAVAEQPTYWVPRLAGLADRLLNRDLQAALDGCWQAGHEGKMTDWDEAITLCEAALTRADALSRERPTDAVLAMDLEGECGRLAQAVVRVVKAAASDWKPPAAATLMQPMLGVLEQLLQDSDPTPDIDARYADEPVHGALNGIRSQALDAVIALALGAHPDARQIDTPALTHMPEIQRLLDDHLDIEKEPSPVVRAVYGMRLGHLFYLDEGWTVDRLNAILDRSRPALAAAAWRGYVIGAHLSPRVFSHVLNAGLYDDPVAQLHVGPSGDDEHREAREARKHLIDHVALMWCGAVSGSNALLDQLFATAIADDRREFITWIGLKVLHDEEAAELAAEVAVRLPELWARRLDELEANGGDPELAGYGWWYSSGALAEPEATRLLVRTLEMTEGRVTDLRGCLERAAEVAPENPGGACEVLAAIVAGDGREELRTVGDRVRRLLSGIASSTDVWADTGSQVERLVHDLGEHGLGDYRDVLSPDRRP